ncbi:MAG: hypothetical protein V1744_06295 [Candidatus Altiarchaeota archaeon]
MAVKARNSDEGKTEDLLVPVTLSTDVPPTKGFSKKSSVEKMGVNPDEYKLPLHRFKEFCAYIEDVMRNSPYFIVPRTTGQIEVNDFLRDNGIRTEKRIMPLDSTPLVDVAKEIMKHKKHLDDPSVVEGLMKDFLQEDSLKGLEQPIRAMMEAARRVESLKGFTYKYEGVGLYLVENEFPAIQVLDGRDQRRLDVRKVLDNIADMMGKVHSLPFKSGHILHGHPHPGNITLNPADSSIGLIDYSEAGMVSPDWGDGNSIADAFYIDYAYLNEQLLPALGVKDDRKREFFRRLVGHYPIQADTERKKKIVEHLVETGLGSYVSKARYIYLPRIEHV